MATKFTINANNNLQKLRDVAFIGSSTTYEFDFRPWGDDNNSVSSVTWETVSGDATVSNKTLTNQVASALITFPSARRSIIKITASSSAEVYVLFLDILAKDFSEEFDDYI